VTTVAGRVGVKVLKDFFGYKPNEGLREFAAEAMALSDEDFEQLKTGIENGSLTY
jgi:hypothetical protein